MTSVIHAPRWDFESKLSLLLGIIMGRVSYAEAAAKYDVSVYEIKKILTEITQLPNSNIHTSAFIFKNVDGVYVDYNPAAAKTLNVSGGRLPKYFTDQHVSPEFGEKYIRSDREAMRERKSVFVSDNATHKDLGVLKVNAHVEPVIDDNDDVRGVLVKGTFGLDILTQSFSTVVQHVRQGYAHLYIKQKQITLAFLSGSVVLYEREIEIILYLLASMRPKEIALRMRTSFRTVENIIARIKSKLGVSYASQIFDVIFAHDFFNLIS